MGGIRAPGAEGARMGSGTGDRASGLHGRERVIARRPQEVGRPTPGHDIGQEVILVEFLAVKPCKYDAFEAVPKGKVSLDLDKIEKVLSQNGYEILSNPRVMLVV